MVGSEGYTYLDMPEPIYEFFRDYRGDFRLINEQFLVDLASQNKPIILETPWNTLQKLDTTTAYWEALQFLNEYEYNLVIRGGPNGYDLLTPPK